MVRSWPQGDHHRLPGQNHDPLAVAGVFQACVMSLVSIISTCLLYNCLKGTESTAQGVGLQTSLSLILISPFEYLRISQQMGMRAQGLALQVHMRS